jgi:hypothetical protein
MNYTNPDDPNHQDDPKDWLNSALVFARALALIFHEGEGIVVNVVGDMDMGDTKKVLVYYKDEQVRVIPFDDRPDIEEGEFVNVFDFNEN